MKVTALKPHNNGYGDAYEKAAGDSYDMPDELAGPLIDAGLIETAPEGAEAEAKPKVRTAKNG